MVTPSQIEDGMEVVGSDDLHVGTVDRVEDGARIKLSKGDRDAVGHHHLVPLDWVASVGGGKVKLDKPAAIVEASWQTMD